MSVYPVGFWSSMSFCKALMAVEEEKGHGFFQRLALVEMAKSS